MASIHLQLVELRVVRDSLLPGESIVYVEGAQGWSQLVDDDEKTKGVPLASPSTNCRFEVKVLDAPLWLEIELPPSYPTGSEMLVSVKVTDVVERREQEKWQAIIKGLLVEIARGSEYPVFDLLSIVLPQIHDFRETILAAEAEQLKAGSSLSEEKPAVLYHHALFTSHHLISVEKRRSMQKWASDLSLSGFAKVGYPGVIYCEGEKGDVDEFVSNVKAMQWLALHLRFIEPIPEESASKPNTDDKEGGDSRRAWFELQKVAEVVDYMRKLHREAFVLDVGLGSTGANARS